MNRKKMQQRKNGRFIAVGKALPRLKQPERKTTRTTITSKSNSISIYKSFLADYFFMFRMSWGENLHVGFCQTIILLSSLLFTLRKKSFSNFLFSLNAIKVEIILQTENVSIRPSFLWCFLCPPMP